MANSEHLKILKQGVAAWNRWREENPDIEVNLSRAHPHAGYFLSIGSDETLYRSKNIGLNLSRVDLTGTCFNDNSLSWTDLRDANLRGAYFFRASLFGVDLTGANLDGAEFSDASIGFTIFGNNDLSKVKGLETVRHAGPSSITIDTLYISSGMIPDVFLRGCGLPDWQIESSKLYQPELSNEQINTILYKVYALRAHQAIQINPLFISYSHIDSPFIDAIEECLTEKGIRFWRDVYHTTAGHLETQIDHAIRLNPTVLLVLSEHSVRSDWVQHEARLARKLEVETNRHVLCPIALDDSWKTCRWPERIREQITEYNILDFSGWRDEDKFWRMFSRLLDGLDLFYK